MAREAAEIPDDELFVTAALVEYDPLAHRLTVINHGHIEPVLISRGEVMTLSGPPSLPLGLGALADESPVPVHHRFLRGDVLLLCTDGLIEARDPSGEFVDLAKLEQALAEQQLDAALDRLVEVVNEHVQGRLGDDLALLGLEYAPRAVRPSRVATPY
jgi:serine phosphatase RsbU (regulator of sigma subunit)